MLFETQLLPACAAVEPVTRPFSWRNVGFASGNLLVALLTSRKADPTNAVSSCGHNSRERFLLILNFGPAWRLIIETFLIASSRACPDPKQRACVGRGQIWEYLLRGRKRGVSVGLHPSPWAVAVALCQFLPNRRDKSRRKQASRAGFTLDFTYVERHQVGCCLTVRKARNQVHGEP